MIITLTTDFGLSDPFVGIMKGVIYGIAPDVQVVDITHDIGSFDFAEGAFLLHSAFRYFPNGTIHVAVVDPGVGSNRRPVAACAHDHFFIAPDNGVLAYVLHTEMPESIPPVYQISNESLFVAPISSTFHGRDIFAPTAAHLARGTPVESVGDRIVDFIRKPLPRARRLAPNWLSASVIRVDKYGNIVTNLLPSDLDGEFVIRIAGVEIVRLCRSFSEGQPGEFFAIEGSTGYIELALNKSAAGALLNVHPGTEFEVETEAPNQ